MAGLIRLQAFTEGRDAIKLLIGTNNCLRMRSEYNDDFKSCQVYYRLSGRKSRFYGHEWIVARPGPGTSVYLHEIIPNQQYQVSVEYTSQTQMQFRQLFHFCSPQIFSPDTKVKIFNNTPSNHNQTSAASDQDLLLIEYTVAVLLKEASAVIERIDPKTDEISVQRAIAEWGIQLLEKVVQNNELADKKSLVVRAIMQSMLGALDPYQSVLEGAAESEQVCFTARLQIIFERCFKQPEHKRSGKASHILRTLKYIARELFQVQDDDVCYDEQTYSQIQSELVDFPATSTFKSNEVNTFKQDSKQSHPISFGTNTYAVQFEELVLRNMQN